MVLVIAMMIVLTIIIVNTLRIWTGRDLPSARPICVHYYSTAGPQAL